MDSLILQCPAIGNNPLMCKLGEVCMRVSGLTSGQIAIFNIEKTASTVVVEVRIVGDLQFTDSTGTENLGKNITLPVNAISNNFYLKGEGECLMFVGNKYKWRGFSVTSENQANLRVSFHDADLTYIPNLVRLRLYRPALSDGRIDLAQLKGYHLEYIATRSDGSFYGDISNIADASNQIIEIPCNNYTDSEPKVTGDIAVLANSTLMTSINFSYTKVFGDIEYLARLIELTNLDIRYTNVSGRLEDMLDGMVTAGRSSGTLTIKAQNSGVLLNGDVLSSNKIATFSGGSWTIE